MENLPGEQPDEANAESVTSEIEDTREFTEDEAMALKIYAEWCKHRGRRPDWSRYGV